MNIFTAAVLFNKLCSASQYLLLQIYLNLFFIILHEILWRIYLYLLKSVKTFKQRTNWKNSLQQQSRKVRPNPGTPEPLGHPGPPGLLVPRDSQYLRIPWTPKTPMTFRTSDPLGPQELRTLGQLPLPFDIQNLNTVQLFLICCKKILRWCFSYVWFSCFFSKGVEQLLYKTFPSGCI